MSSSKALARDSRFKQFMKKTPHVIWEEEQEMKRHRRRVRTIKAAIDNSQPWQFTPLQNRQRQLQEEERLHVIEEENLALLGRLHSISTRDQQNWHFRKPKALIRGDAYRLMKPTGRRIWRYDWQALKGSTMRKSLRVQEEVLRKLVSLKMVDPKEEKWLRKWIPQTREGPVDVLKYNRARKHRDEPPSPNSELDVEPEELLARKTAKLKIK